MKWTGGTRVAERIKAAEERAARERAYAQSLSGQMEAAALSEKMAHQLASDLGRQVRKSCSEAFSITATHEMDKDVFHVSLKFDKGEHDRWVVLAETLFNFSSTTQAYVNWLTLVATRIADDPSPDRDLALHSLGFEAIVSDRQVAATEEALRRFVAERASSPSPGSP